MHSPYDIILFIAILAIGAIYYFIYFER